MIEFRQARDKERKREREGEGDREGGKEKRIWNLISRIILKMCNIMGAFEGIVREKIELFCIRLRLDREKMTIAITEREREGSFWARERESSLICITRGTKRNSPERAREREGVYYVITLSISTILKVDGEQRCHAHNTWIVHWIIIAFITYLHRTFKRLSSGFLNDKCINHILVSTFIITEGDLMIHTDYYTANYTRTYINIRILSIKITKI